MSAPNKPFGEGACDAPSCGRPVVWRENGGGTLSYHCQWCGMQSYAKAGSLANADLRERLKPTTEPEAPAAPARAAAVAEVAPLPVPVRSPAVQAAKGAPAKAARNSGLILG